MSSYFHVAQNLLPLNSNLPWLPHFLLSSLSKFIFWFSSSLTFFISSMAYATRMFQFRWCGQPSSWHYPLWASKRGIRHTLQGHMATSTSTAIAVMTSSRDWNPHYRHCSPDEALWVPMDLPNHLWAGLYSRRSLQHWCVRVGQPGNDACWVGKTPSTYPSHSSPSNPSQDDDLPIV